MNFILKTYTIFLFVICTACGGSDERERSPENEKISQNTNDTASESEEDTSESEEDTESNLLEDNKRLEESKETQYEAKPKPKKPKKEVDKSNQIEPKTIESKKPEYDDIGKYFKGRAVVIRKGKHGYIDKSGKEVLGLEYDYAEPFTEQYNLARVRIKDKVGFVDLNGNIVVPLQYRYVEKFVKGLAQARKLDGTSFYIDMKGNKVADVLDTYHSGIARIKLGKKLGYVNDKGQVIIKPKYDYGTHFENGMAEVKQDGKHFYINTSGQCVQDCP